MRRTILSILIISCAAISPCSETFFEHRNRQYPLYPAVTTKCPDLPSPLFTHDGRDLVIACLADGTYGLVDVSLKNWAGELEVDTEDFPSLAETGLHEPEHLRALQTITGRSVDEITRLARPGGLSEDGFLAADEDIISVLSGDDNLVRTLGLTHAELARPLMHVWNLMQRDLELERWSMRDHRWLNIVAVKYNSRWVLLDAHDTKGGQKSIFDDGIDGGFWIIIRRPLEAKEEEALHQLYHHLGPEPWDTLHGTLTRIYTGEIEPYYIKRYGFYEGHTAWRADPLGIASIFGLRSIEELENAFPHALDRVIRDHHFAQP